MPDALFVYGSLRSEFDNPHARLLRKDADFLGRATVRGSMFLIGPYPGYRTLPDGLVQGELWHLHDPERTLAALDDYEGPEYFRIEIDAEQPDRPATRAWIYLYTGDVATGRPIDSGDFLVL